MNPVVLGAVIGAAPACLTAGVSAWATSRVNSRTLAADHLKWIREKRADIYVEVIKAFHMAEQEILKIKSGDKEENLQDFRRMYRETLRGPASDYTARMMAYCTRASYDAAQAVWEVEQLVWEEVNRELEDDGVITMGETLREAIEEFQAMVWPFLDLAVRELQSFDKRMK